MATVHAHTSTALAVMNEGPTTVGVGSYLKQRNARCVLKLNLLVRLCFETDHAPTQWTLQHEWPDNFQAALDALVDTSVEKVMMGDGAAPHV